MAKNKLKDLYDTLGVAHNASEEDIKKAYRKLSKIYHPDVKSTGDESKFKEISNANEILSDPDKKAKYENEGQHHDNSGFNASMADELFKRHAESFGGYGRRQARNHEVRKRGGDLRINISLSIHEIITGVHKKIKLQRDINCRDCSGTGAKNKESIVNCSDCDGTGRVTIRQQTQMGIFVQQYTCPKCGGEGKEIKHKCNSCDGHGLVSKSDDIEFDIPAGATSAISMNINNVGNEAKGGGDNGNLIIVMEEVEHPILKREGVDIISDIFISYYDAVVGNNSLEINTVDGTAKIKIEPGTESGKILRLKGKGIPNINNPAQRGDQMVYVNIFIPKTLNENEKELIIKLKDIKSAEPNNDNIQHLKGVYSRIREYDDLH